MAAQEYQSPVREEVKQLALEYTAAIKEFLNGDLDKVFDVVAREPFLHNNQQAKQMLAKAIKAQLDDAESYRSLVRLAAAAGVPLVNPIHRLVRTDSDGVWAEKASET